jgi:hypothetical protein
LVDLGGGCATLSIVERSQMEIIMKKDYYVGVYYLEGNVKNEFIVCCGADYETVKKATYQKTKVTEGTYWNEEFVTILAVTQV